MTDQQKKIHAHLMLTLPVRSHYYEDRQEKRTIHNADIGERLSQLEAAGYNRNDMKLKLGVSCQTIIKHLGRKNRRVRT